MHILVSMVCCMRYFAESEYLRNLDLDLDCLWVGGLVGLDMHTVVFVI